MAVTGSTKQDAVTASTKTTRKIIVVGHIGNESARIVAASERMKHIGKDVEVEVVTPEQDQSVERGITITSSELFLPEPFLITNPNADRMYTDYDGKYDKRKGKQGYTRPYKFHK